MLFDTPTVSLAGQTSLKGRTEIWATEQILPRAARTWHRTPCQEAEPKPIRSCRRLAERTGRSRLALSSSKTRIKRLFLPQRRPCSLRPLRRGAYRQEFLRLLPRRQTVLRHSRLPLRRIFCRLPLQAGPEVCFSHPLRLRHPRHQSDQFRFVRQGGDLELFAKRSRNLLQYNERKSLGLSSSFG